MMEKTGKPIRKKDAIIISYLTGVITMILFMILLLMIIPEDKDSHRVYSSFSTFRFLMMIMLVPLATSVCISIFKKFKVNYYFIF